jgi:hypothetical protein
MVGTQSEKYKRDHTNISPVSLLNENSWRRVLGVEKENQ